MTKRQEHRQLVEKQRRARHKKPVLECRTCKHWTKLTTLPSYHNSTQSVTLGDCAQIEQPLRTTYATHGCRFHGALNDDTGT